MPEKNGAGKFDTSLIRELAAILREADLGEIEIEQDNMRIRVSKSEPQAMMMAPSYAAGPAPAAAPAAASAAPRAAAPAGDHPGTVKSPMVGTVYLQAEAGADAFINVGDNVKEGQTLLLIEAMKTFNPVLAPRAGKITKIVVTNEQPVEFGEPLVVIE